MTSVPQNFNLSGDHESSFGILPIQLSLIPLADKILSKLWIQYRNKIDRYIIYKRERWAFSGALLLLYLIRVLANGGFYVISYVLGLYMLHALVKFVTPLGLPDIEEEEEEKIGEELPIFSQYIDIINSLFIIFIGLLEIPSH